MPIARRLRRSLASSTAFHLPSSLQRRGCGCCRRRRSSNACATGFALLAGARGAAARQATLRGAIDWSWELLTDLGAGARRAVRDVRRRIHGGSGGSRDRTGRLAASAADDGCDSGARGQEPASHLGSGRASPLRHRRAVLRDVLEHSRVCGGEARCCRLRGSTQDVEERHGRYFAGFGTDKALEALSAARRREASAHTFAGAR